MLLSNYIRKTLFGLCRKLLILLTAAVVLSSCKTMFTMDTIMQIKKGDLLNDVHKMVDLEPRYNFTVLNSGNEYTVRTYRIMVGVKTTQENTQTTATSSTGVFSTTNSSTERKNELSLDYFFLFDRDNKLMFWGFLQEFSKNEDPFVAGIAPMIQEKYYSFLDL